jgi:hypothetical protein
MRKGYVFGSSTPRQLSHQKAKEKSSVLEALSNDINHDVHDVRTFVKNIHNPSREFFNSFIQIRDYKYITVFSQLTIAESFVL